MKNSYVVCVKSPSDWSEIHKLLLLDGTLEDNLPSRACECVDAKEVYDNRATYLLDEEEVESIKKHEKVEWVSLDPSIHTDADGDYTPAELKFEQIRFESDPKFYRGVDSFWPRSSPPAKDADVDVTNSARAGTDIVYATSPNLELDVSYFPNGGNRPVVIGVHGGSFMSGNKDGFDGGSDKGNYFTGLGYNYVGLNYRLLENNNLLDNISGSVVDTVPGSTTLDYTSTDWTDRLSADDQMFDLAQALRWVIFNAASYGLDADNIILFGFSSGAHLVAQAATRKEYLESTGVDINRIKGCIITDTSTFDLKNKLTSYATATNQNAWMFMNAYGLHPNINTVDYSTLEVAEAAWSDRSPQENIKNNAKPKTDFAKSFCIVTRGTDSRRAEAEEFKSEIVKRGIPVTFLDYEKSGGADITAGGVTYDHPGIHAVLGGTDIPDNSSAFNHISIKSMSTEIGKYLNSVIVPLATELNRTSWHLSRLKKRESFWVGSTTDFAKNKNPITNLEPPASRNQVFTGQVKETNISYPPNNTGLHVDAVVIDNGAWHGHPEFVDAAGVSQIKDVILDGPYYLDKEYFDTNSKTTTFLGRTTCTEVAAREWWSDGSKRSSKFSTAPTLASGSVPAAYTRANICGSYSAYPSYAGTEATFADHGTPVASSVYGKNFGWAFQANKWNVASNIGLSGLIDVTKIYEILKIFVDNKPSVSGIKYPTIINSSYGLTLKVAGNAGNNWIAGTYYYNFREEATGTFTNKATAPEFLKNFSSSDNSLYGISETNTAHRAAGDDLANTPGVIWFASAGNNNQLQVMEDDPDYNNYWSTVNPASDAFDDHTDAFYVNRRGSPADFGYDSTEEQYKVISVGALSAFLDSSGKEGKDWYSNSGTAVDVFSPGTGGLSAAGNSSQEAYPRYDSQEFYSWLSKDAYDCNLVGTSTSSPVLAGFIASKLSNFYYWSARSVRKYIEGVMENQLLSTFNVGSGLVTTSNAAEWGVSNNLFGQEPKVSYDEVVSPLFFIANLPAETEVDNTETSVTLEVRISSNLASSYSYQWQVSAEGQSYLPIPGETSRSLTFKSAESEDDDHDHDDDDEHQHLGDSTLNRYYRVEVISNGPYLQSYSSSTLLKLKPTEITILKQPISIQPTEGRPALLSVKVETTSSGTINYEWQKLNTSSNEWETISGATKQNLSFDDIRSSSNGEYRCAISDGSSPSVTSNSVTINVIVPKLEFTLEPQNVATFVGNSTTLVVNVSSTTTATVSYQWQFSENDKTWTSIVGEKTPSLVLNNLQASQNGYYRCRAVDNVSINSPAFSASVRVQVKAVILTSTTTRLDTSVVEGDELSLQVAASINDISKTPSFSFQKSYMLGGQEKWRIVDVNSDGIFYIKTISKEQQGKYRCLVSHPVATNSPITVAPINVAVLDSFAVSNVSSDPATINVDGEVSLSPTINISNDKLFFYYIWERKEDGSSDWKLIDEAQSKVFTFKATGKDYLDKFRCKITNNLGTVKYTSPDFQLSFAPFVDVTKDLQKNIYFKENSQQIHVLDPEVVSTHLSTVTYVWQKSLDYSLSDGVPVPTTWSDIATETDKKIELTPSKIQSLNSGNTDDFYFVRLKINFGQNSTTSFSEPTRIDLKDVYNLFGECLSREAADNLYNTDSIDSRSEHGQESLPDRQYIETINVDPVNPTDKCGDKNTCGISIDELLETYSIYNTQKGLYKSWGDIEFPWQLEEALNPPGVTCNLNAAETNDKWQVSQYKSLYSYFPKIEAGGLSSPADATCLTERPADRVLRIEDDGYKISLYEAQELVTSLAGPFDKTKWKKICHVITSVPAGLPTPEEIKERYKPYELDFFLKEWEEYNATWDEDFYQQSFDQCRNVHSVLADIEKCMRDKNGPYGQSNDQWEQARIRKDFFYEVGDYVWIEGECKDTVCLYICIENIPATKSIFDQLRQFKARLNPSSSVTNYTVTVQGVSAGNRYFVDGSQQPTLNLTEGQTYRFNQDDSSNTNHPLRFSTAPNGTHGGGVEFTEGVTKVGTAGSNGAYTEITVPVGTPTLYYYCANHSLMGHTAQTPGLTFWQRVYCVNTGMNKCLEPQRERDLPNYQLVELGSLGHYVEQPLPFFDLEGKKLCNDFETLNDVVEAAEPKVLTQEEIDALDQP